MNGNSFQMDFTKEIMSQEATYRVEVNEGADDSPEDRQNLWKCNFLNTHPAIFTGCRTLSLEYEWVLRRKYHVTHDLPCRSKRGSR